MYSLRRVDISSVIDSYSWAIDHIKTRSINISTPELIKLLLENKTIIESSRILNISRKTLERNISIHIPELPPSRGRAVKFRILELLEIGYCTSCKNYLEKEDFTIDNSKVYCLSQECKECASTNRKEYRKNNLDTVRKSEKKYRTKKGTQKKRNAYEATRRSAKLKAAPIWYSEEDSFILEEMYELCNLRKETTGISWHVDHIIPLKNKVVCGLHWHKNWQVITATENLKKGNKLLEKYRNG